MTFIILEILILYDNFIWPLATSYYIATKGSPNVNSQLDNYFKSTQSRKNLIFTYVPVNSIIPY